MNETNQQTSPLSRQLIVATAGHVDHGKTSLVKHLTGVDTDTLAEEKKRGLTINPGFAYHHFQPGDDDSTPVTLGFVDVPGHADFIHNMLAGVGNVEQALLVVACDDGIMPQTREHVAILRLLNIGQLSVALTKIDRATAERVEALQTEIQQTLLSDWQQDTAFFAVNNLNGEGVAALKTHLEQQAGQQSAVVEQAKDFAARFLIDRCFTVKGIGTVITGTLRSGQIAVNDQLVLSSSGEQVRVRGIRLDQQDLTVVSSGQRAAINITAEKEEISRGDWLLGPDNYLPCHRFDAQLQWLDDTMKLSPNAQYHLYLGAADHVANIRLLCPDRALYQIRCFDPLHAHQGDRFIVRDPAANTTLGGGRVLDIHVPRRGRASDERLSELATKQQPPAAALEQLLTQHSSGVDLLQFRINYNLSDVALDRIVLYADASTIAVNRADQKLPWLFHQKHYDALCSLILKPLADFHKEFPQLQGIGEAKLSQAVSFNKSHLLLSGIVERLISDGAIRRSGTLLHLPEHEASLSAEEKEFLEKIHPLLEKHGRIPPRTRELVEMTNIPLKALERILKQCARSGMVVQVASNRFYLPGTIAELAAFTEELANKLPSEDGFSVIQFRDASGIGRNLCIEILEYFDSVGFTRRDDNKRFLRTDKDNIFG